MRQKGLSPNKYWLYTVLLWFGAEVAGFFFGFMIVGTDEQNFFVAYFFGIAGAIVGALISWYLAENADSVLPSAGPGWLRTHLVPDTGMQAWPAPNPSVPPVAVLPPRLELALRDRQGDWALVQAANGWSGWVDARLLVALGMPVAPFGVAPAAPTGAAPTQ